MLHRKRLERDSENPPRRAKVQRYAFEGPAIFQGPPCALGSIDRARRAIFQAPGLVRMRMRQDDGIGFEFLELAQPIQSAIQHDFFSSATNEK